MIKFFSLFSQPNQKFLFLLRIKSPRYADEQRARAIYHSPKRVAGTTSRKSEKESEVASISTYNRKFHEFSIKRSWGGGGLNTERVRGELDIDPKSIVTINNLGGSR